MRLCADIAAPKYNAMRITLPALLIGSLVFGGLGSETAIIVACPFPAYRVPCTPAVALRHLAHAIR